MVHALRPDGSTQSDIAAALGISPQAVGYRLKGSFGTEVRQALRAWEEDVAAETAVRAAAS
jgi:predicted transcriptional regulator